MMLLATSQQQLDTPKLLGPLLKCINAFVLIQSGVNIHQDLSEQDFPSGCPFDRYPHHCSQENRVQQDVGAS